MKISKECEHCGKVFWRYPSQMVGVKYCCMDCRRNGQSVLIECEWCGKAVRKAKSLAQHKDVFCSKSCHDQFQGRHKVVFTCEVCFKEFFWAMSMVKQAHEKGKKIRFCSTKCAKTKMSGTNHPAFSGGSSFSNDGSCLVLFPEKGKAGRYVRTHRLVAEEMIGRPLAANEHVINLDRDKRNNHPDNLYVCDSISECQLILSGSLPFPAKSNLKSLAKRVSH